MPHRAPSAGGRQRPGQGANRSEQAAKPTSGRVCLPRQVTGVRSLSRHGQCSRAFVELAALASRRPTAGN